MRIHTILKPKGTLQAAPFLGSKMSSCPQFEDDFAGINEGDSYLSPLFNFRPRSRTMIGLGHSQLFPVHASFLPLHKVLPKRSAPHLRLRVSIPEPPPTTAPSSISPQSESLETPVSLSSPIAGVVDLTKDVKTISTFAVAQGGLSDIYKGEWYQLVEDDCDGESKEIVVPVCHLFF